MWVAKKIGMPKNGVNTLQSSMKSTLYKGLYPFVKTGHNTTDIQHDNTTKKEYKVYIALLFIKCFFEILFYSLPYLVGEAEDVILCECQTRRRLTSSL